MTQINSFLTIEGKSEGFYKEKGSKFNAYAYPIKSEDDARTIVKNLKKEFYDARHHCYAFMLGADKSHFRAADDGEPSNSAGNPILGQIKSVGLTNILVVVVRYFGGTKLGVPGLINAYKTSAQEAIANALIVERKVTKALDLKFPYSAMNEVMKVIKDFPVNIEEQGYEGAECTMSVVFEIEFEEQVLAGFEKYIRHKE